MPKTAQLTIRLTASQKEALSARAIADGRGIASYIIHKLRLGSK